MKNTLRNIGLKVLMHKPSMYSKSVVLNVLGMQVYRILFFYLRRVLRTPKRSDPRYARYFAELKQEGCTVIPNFFSEETYKRIHDEYFALVPQFGKSLSSVELPHVERMDIHDSRVSNFFRDSFCSNELIKNVVTSYLNRTFNLPYEADLTRIYCRTEEEMRSPQNGGTNNLHFDVPFRCLKAFYYVTDTKRENAALKYCLGSNKRLSLRRLWLEYKLSIRYALNKDNYNHGGEYKDGEPWVVVTDKEIRDNNLYDHDMEVKGNTLVIVDIGGFHRRGNFSTTTPRETVELNFRNMDTLRNDVYPFEQALRAHLRNFGQEVRPHVA